MHDARNTVQAISSHGDVAQPLDSRAPDCAGEVVQRSKRAQAEAERRAKKKYAERWHKSMGGREQVSNVRGYSTPPAAFNRPSVDDWAPTYPARRMLSDRVPAAVALMGYDVERMTAEDYAWLAGG